MPSAVKLLTGVAATVLLARAATFLSGGVIYWHIARAGQQALLAHGVQDGSLSFRQRGGWADGLNGRIVHVAGTADAATRAAVLARIRRHPGVIDATWDAR